MPPKNGHPNWSPITCKVTLHMPHLRATFIQYQKASDPQVFLWGGETTVNVTGNGRGGRNQELASRAALLLQNRPGNWAFLSGGTDGRDGPTDSAGGMADENTLLRIAKAGADIHACLRNSDSY